MSMMMLIFVKVLGFANKKTRQKINLRSAGARAQLSMLFTVNVITKCFTSHMTT